ncbi:uncharacterized protein [Henckelia pumila]|uniref:uncharacterized protein n=1 Tax=Henckelia pumila TaxID=405737 RepID=UPI003C6DFEC9
MAETQNQWPKIPKLQHDFSWDEPIPEITSFFRVQKLSERAIFPSRASFLSAGYDLSSSADITVPARSQAVIPTDLSIAVSQGTYAQIAPRPGLTWNRWIEVGSGVFGADYKGPVWVILINHSDVDFEVKMGYKIAQLIIQKIMYPEFMMPPPQMFSPPPPSIIPPSVRQSGFDREPIAPVSKLHSQFPPHLTEPVLENINLEDNEEDDEKLNVLSNKVKVTWTMEEEKCLAKACVTVANDPKVGSAQKSKHFWQITTVYYNENRPVGTSPREWTSFKAHYYHIMFDVRKFSGWYDNLFQNRVRGESDADVLADTHDRWKKEHKNKVFKYEHVWKIITESTKSASQSHGCHIDKKAKTSESRTQAFSINLDTDTDSESSHPIEQLKVERKIEAEVTEDEIVNEKWEQMQQYRMEKLMWKEAEIKQKEIELKQRDYDFLMKDTRDMTKIQLHWHMKIVEQIAKRRDLK